MHLTEFLYLSSCFVAWHSHPSVPTPCILQSFSIFLLTSLPGILVCLYLLHPSYKVSLSFCSLRCLAFSRGGMNFINFVINWSQVVISPGSNEPTHLFSSSCNVNERIVKQRSSCIMPSKWLFRPGILRIG